MIKMDMFKEMESFDASTKVIKTKRGRNSGGPISFELTNEDNDLMTLLKTLVNDANINYTDVYESQGKTLGMNMITSIRNGQISWDRFKKWMDVLKLDVSIQVSPKK